VYLISLAMMFLVSETEMQGVLSIVWIQSC
jgi:hypothetical protein